MYYVFCDGQMGGVAWDEAEAIRTCAALTILHPECTYGYCTVLLWDAEMERLGLAA